MAFVGASPAAAEPMFKLEQQLPEMLLRICPTLADAKAEAALAKKLGAEPMKMGVLGKLRYSGCDSSFVSIYPLSRVADIEPYVAWQMSYDSGSKDTIRFVSETRIPVSIKRTMTRWYFAKFKDTKSRWFEGWAELPDQPYALQYLQQKKANQ